MADMASISEPGITWDPDGPFDPDAIYGSKPCSHCGHRAHYALRCGAPDGDGLDGQTVGCECLTWDDPPEPQPF